MGVKNSGRTATVNIFCSKRKESLHSNSQISLPVSKCALAGKIEGFLPAWKLLTKDQELLALVEGYQIPFLMEPVQEKTPEVPKLNQE